MKAIYVTSSQRASGKTALCVGLLNHFQADGFAVGYMKPISTTARAVDDQVLDEDALFIKTTFNLSDSMKAISPVLLTPQEVEAVIESGEEKNFEERVFAAYEAVSRNKEVLVLEGGTSLLEGWIINLAPPRLSSLLNVRELVVVPFISHLQVVDDLLTSRIRLGESILGGVINSVPKHFMDFVQQKVKPFLERRDVPIFAILPREKILISVTVAELSSGLGGEVLTAPHALNELVENLMVGAMSVESALSHFRRRPNKAVVTGGDRPDIQLAALETSTRCLILTGNLRPGPLILGRAEERGVPIILTHHDTMTAIELIEGFFGRTRFHQEQKVQYFGEMLRQFMDFEALYRALEITPRGK
jgi:hypothetical protein